MKDSKKVFRRSIWMLLVCFAMLVGTTYAWFTDGASSSNNIIQSGNLDVEMYWTDDLSSGEWLNVEEDEYNTIFNNTNWEPGYTEVRYIKIKNAGDLAFKYQLEVTPQGEIGKLADVIDVYFAKAPTANIESRSALADMTLAGSVAEVSADSSKTENKLLPIGKTHQGWDSGEAVTAIALKMDESAGNEYQSLTIADGFTVSAVATQVEYEVDSFGSDYDRPANYPEVKIETDKSEKVEIDGNNTTTSETVIKTWKGVKATIPAGVKVADGYDKLTLRISEKASTDSNVKVSANEILTAYDVHIEGVAEDNTVPIIIELGEILPTGLNFGNYKFYHVEDGNTVDMNLVDAVDKLTTHNDFYYDPATGEVTLAMATFSEVAMVSETEGVWKGEFDYSWYVADATELTIANADQLAAFGKVVGGMAEDFNRDSFNGKSVKLIADINLGDKDNSNESLIFHPIGYYYKGGDSTVKSFEGTFDGNGHTISNFYQNTWEIKGDYDGTYYKDAMGLFGYVYGGTVKNLTVDNFSSDGEFTPTGVIAAYADGNATFENIAITNCNPRVYNTGNGGIIGIAGDTSAANDDHITLKNITVDNSNKISALWGSWDVACGGLVGMYRGNVDGNGNATGDTISFENCHVSAQIDVYNDVCANYQYYAYRYAGMIIGSIRHNTTNDEGRTIPNMAGISASGCTVNYGDWNDYYYCEFEKNTMASYSEDYQFSRVPHSELNFTDSNGNGAVDADERASVAGCKHTHTVNEDKKAVYLPFHQLFTGYSWGVSSIGLEKYSGIVTNLDITEGEQQESVVKFKALVKDNAELSNNKEITIGELFSAMEANEDKIKDDKVKVMVSPVGETSTVNGEYLANESDWTKGTLTFTGSGTATVTITDYYFCTPTTITVDVI
ncbi:MAG: hypothetical protein IKJ85_06795, partial [Firmicutes bacterium]|nr:hypothetical protein [Bacillota bacterium]